MQQSGFHFIFVKFQKAKETSEHLQFFRERESRERFHKGSAMGDDEFHLGSGNWWDTSRNRFDGGSTTPALIPTTLNAIASFGWPPEMVDMKSRSSIDSATPPSADQPSARGGGGVSDNPNLQMMELGLSSQSLDWNQSLL